MSVPLDPTGSFVVQVSKVAEQLKHLMQINTNLDTADKINSLVKLSKTPNLSALIDDMAKSNAKQIEIDVVKNLRIQDKHTAQATYIGAKALYNKAIYRFSDKGNFVQIFPSFIWTNGAIATEIDKVLSGTLKSTSGITGKYTVEYFIGDASIYPTDKAIRILDVDSTTNLVSISLVAQDPSHPHLLFTPEWINSFSTSSSTIGIIANYLNALLPIAQDIGIYKTLLAEMQHIQAISDVLDKLVLEEQSIYNSLDALIGEDSLYTNLDAILMLATDVETARQAAEIAAAEAIKAMSTLKPASTVVAGITQYATQADVNIGSINRAVTANLLKATNDALNQIVVSGAPEATESIKGIIRISSSVEALDGTDAESAMSPARVKEAVTAFTPVVPNATEAVSGISAKATETEALDGIDDTKHMTPAKVKAVIDQIPSVTIEASTEAVEGVSRRATLAEAIAGTDTDTTMSPARVKDVINVSVLDATESTKGVSKRATETEAVDGLDNETHMTPYLTKYVVDNVNIAVPLATPDVAGTAKMGTLEKYLLNTDKDSFVTLELFNKITALSPRWNTANISLYPLSRVASGNNVYVATTTKNANSFHVSFDKGVSWSTSNALTAQSGNAITYGAGLFVYPSETNDTVYKTSPDGITWTQRAFPANIPSNAIVYSPKNSLFYVFPSNASKVYYTSPNGINWTSNTAAISANFYASGVVASPDGTIVVVGAKSILILKDTWKTFNITYDSYNVAYGNGVFVVILSGNVVYTSSDGENWTISGVALPRFTNFIDITFSEYSHTFIAVAWTGVMNNIAVYSSVDGKVWVKTGLEDIVLNNRLVYISAVDDRLHVLADINKIYNTNALSCVTVLGSTLTAPITYNSSIDANMSPQFTVPPNYTTCAYIVRGGGNPEMGGSGYSASIYRNNTLIAYSQEEWSSESGNFSCVAGDIIRVQLDTYDCYAEVTLS